MKGCFRKGKGFVSKGKETVLDANEKKNDSETELKLLKETKQNELKILNELVKFYSEFPVKNTEILSENKWKEEMLKWDDKHYQIQQDALNNLSHAEEKHYRNIPQVLKNFIFGIEYFNQIWCTNLQPKTKFPCNVIFPDTMRFATSTITFHETEYSVESKIGLIFHPPYGETTVGDVRTRNKEIAGSVGWVKAEVGLREGNKTDISENLKLQQFLVKAIVLLKSSKENKQKVQKNSGNLKENTTYNAQEWIEFCEEKNFKNPFIQFYNSREADKMYYCVDCFAKEHSKIFERLSLISKGQFEFVRETKPNQKQVQLNEVKEVKKEGE